MFPIRPATSPEARRSRTEAAAHDASPAAGEDAQASPPASPALEALPRAASRRRPRPEDSPDEAPAARAYRAGSPMDASRATLSRLPAPSLDSMLRAWELRGAPGERRADAARRVLACSTAPAGAPTELDLSNLALSELPPGLDRLRLQSLVLVDNALSEIRLPDQGLPGLEELWRARNPLRDLTGLLQQGQIEQARALADTLLEPQFLAQLHSLPASRMGAHEARAMNTAHARYMDLLTALARDGLIDPAQAFDRLRSADAMRGETPYLLHIASRIAAGQRGMTAAPELAHAVTRLLDTLAGEREKTEGQGVRASMRQALLSQEHTRQVSLLGKDRRARWLRRCSIPSFSRSSTACLLRAWALTKPAR